MKNEEKSKRRGFDAFIIIYMKVKRVEEKWVWEKNRWARANEQMQTQPEEGGGKEIKIWF